MRLPQIQAALVSRLWLSAPLILFFLYLLTLPHTVTFEDDGLFLMTGYFAGIPHPPGYPLYSLVSALAALFPAGTIPMRLHALSAMFGATTCLMIALIVRRLLASDLSAFLAALACGVTAILWSQSLIAEVYTLNTTLVFTLVWLSLQATAQVDPGRRHAGLISFALGLSLALHWPLIALSVPALAALLWPVRREFPARPARNFALLALGLTPYLWMLIRSHGTVAVNFSGPIQSIHDFWYILTRQAYIDLDVSRTAGGGDLLRYAGFLWGQVLTQYTVPGFLLIAAGFVAQWRQWQRRIAVALTLLFACHTLPFLLLIHFDYDDLSRAAFSVYPLVAYGTMAIWLALGLQVCATGIMQRFPRQHWRAPLQCIAGGLIIAATLSQNLDANDRHDFTAARDYARAVFAGLPAGADLFVSGDMDSFVLGYMHLVEGLRPDVTLYDLNGLVFSNRLFHPYHATAAERLGKLERHVQEAQRPVCTTEEFAAAVPKTDHWLFSCMNPSAGQDGAGIALDRNLINFYQRLAAERDIHDPWARHHRQQLLKRAGRLLGRSGTPDMPAGMALLRGDFYSVLGYLDGGLTQDGAAPARTLVDAANSIKEVPNGAAKRDIGRFMELRGLLHEQTGERELALKTYEQSVAWFPDPANGAIDALLRIYASRHLVVESDRLRRRFRP